jgi:carbon-monoxide dehydrogenase large subunit
VQAVFTTTNPLGPYRGSGRPETTFLIERLIDKAARETGISPIELRRLNLIPTSAMPYKTPGGSIMDCGDLARSLQEALDLADWSGLERRKAGSRCGGRLRGFGVGLHAENAAQLSERVDLHIDPSGSAAVHVGTVASGQSHETMYSQMVSGWLGIPLDQIRVVQGDTDKVAFGRGTLAARTAVIGGSALRYATDNVVERGKRIAAFMLEVSEQDVEFDHGMFKVSGTDRSVSLKAVARKAYATDLPMELGIGLEGQGAFAGPQTYPYGCMVCEVEIDPATGALSLDKFLFVDDVGIAINPMVVEGQTHGSIAQASGQVLMEDVVFDPDSGQLLSGSFQDYCMPRADNFPFFTSAYIVIPTKTNPLGAKGGSETGSFGAPPAIVNAILDALSPLGATDIDLPATSERIWQAIAGANSDAAGNPGGQPRDG